MRWENLRFSYIFLGFLSIRKLFFNTLYIKHRKMPKWGWRMKRNEQIIWNVIERERKKVKVQREVHRGHVFRYKVSNGTLSNTALLLSSNWNWRASQSGRHPPLWNPSALWRFERKRALFDIFTVMLVAIRGGASKWVHMSMDVSTTDAR